VRRLAGLALVLGAWSCAATAPRPPLAERVDVVDDYHGTRVADPYRWLEDPDSPRTRSWIEAENRVTRAHLDAVPERAAIAERVAELWTYESFGIPRRHGDWTYFTYNDGHLSQSQLVRTRSFGGGHEVVLDPNTFSADGTVSLGGTSFSHAGRYLAFGISDGGSDWRTWRVRDLESGRDLPDVIEWSRFSTPSWAADDSGFFYGRYPEADRKLVSRAHDQAVWFHVLGTEQSQDVLIHRDPEHPDRSFDVEATKDGRWLSLSVREGTARKNRLWFRAAEAGNDAPWMRRFDEFDAFYEVLGNVGSRFWIRTDNGAPRGRVVRIDLDAPGAPLEEVVAEGEDVLDSASLVGDRLILVTLEDATSRVRTADLDGRPLGALALPGLGTARGFEGEPGDVDTFFSFQSFLEPTSNFRYDLASEEVEPVTRPRVPFDGSAYETHQHFLSSRDGTRVPIFVTHAKGLVLDGTNPTLLYGYGGFDIPMQPAFSPANAAWLDLGGVYAVACLRGGGEYGREWHLAGTKEHKQNVFDDFIAAAEWLVSEGYTSSERLAIHGGSNGGLLVGACLNQRPDLFAAAVPSVGVMDMLRYHLFTIGAAWASDYGRSDDPAMFPHLLAYSPYHNVRPGARYPAVLVTTADHDDRVVPAHSFKYAAALQAAQGGDEPILIRIDTRAGHGAGKSREQSIEEVTDRLTFLYEELDLRAVRAEPR